MLKHYRDYIIDVVKDYPELKIIDALRFYNEKFNSTPKPTFYKVISRLTNEGKLVRLTSGIYCKPKQDGLKTIISSDKEILEHYLGKRNKYGVIIGEHLYEKYKLTKCASSNIKVYSNISSTDQKRFERIRVIKVDIDFNTPTIKIIELLEILQHYDEITDLNKENLVKYFEDAVKYYNNKVLNKIKTTINYRKSTFISLKNILDYYGTKNNISTFVSNTSSYKAISVEKLHELLETKTTEN